MVPRRERELGRAPDRADLGLHHLFAWSSTYDVPVQQALDLGLTEEAQGEIGMARVTVTSAQKWMATPDPVRQPHPRRGGTFRPCQAGSPEPGRQGSGAICLS